MRASKFSSSVSAFPTLVGGGTVCVYLYVREYDCANHEESGRLQTASFPSLPPPLRPSLPHSPLLQLANHALHVLQAHIPSHRPLHSKQAPALIQSAGEEAHVDGLNDQVFDFPDIAVNAEFLEEGRVRDALLRGGKGGARKKSEDSVRRRRMLF